MPQIMNKLKGKIIELSLHMYGCRVIQKSLEVVDIQNVIMIFHEVKDYIHNFILDRNGNHMVQKLIQRLSKEEQLVKELLKVFIGMSIEYAKLQYGCRIIQKILDNCKEEDYQLIIDELLSRVYELTQDQYGNYVIQHLIEKNDKDVIEKIWNCLKGKIFDLSIHKFASNIIEKLLTFGSTKIRNKIILEIIEKDNHFSDSLLEMVKDKYGNYVVQKLIEVADYNIKDNIVKRIITSQSLKKRDEFSKLFFN